MAAVYIRLLVSVILSVAALEDGRKALMKNVCPLARHVTVNLQLLCSAQET